MPYLTKARFNLALDCPTKLFYRENKEYHDESKEDLFFQALAEGGYQVGELAKYLFVKDPQVSNISVDTLDADESLAQTKRLRESGYPLVISEAAFLYENYFIRVDLLVEEKNTINIYEVKAKSWDESVEFLKTKKTGERSLVSDWLPYLYDIAFQKYVVQKANPDKRVNAHIILADKTKEAEIDGLNQLFRIRREGDRVRITVEEGITAEDLGTIPLKILNVDEACSLIYNEPVKVDLEGEWKFEDLLKYFSDNLISNQSIWSPVGKRCGDCQFVNPDFPNGLKSGFHECWMHQRSLAQNDFQKPLVLELWGGHAGNRSLVQDAIEKGINYLDDVEEGDFAPKNGKEPTGTDLDPTARRTLQVRKSRADDFSPFLNKEGIRELFDTLAPPYHFIDFETSMVALPFKKGCKPYEAIAFQYSYHRMDEKGRIRHMNDYLSFEPGVFPNYEFLRSLKNDLGGKKGTIFRYHQHENNYLNHLYRQLMEEDQQTIADKNDLINFIKEIAHPTRGTTENWQPLNEMKDLFEYVLKHFYSLYAGGSNSIKDILPAVIKSSEFIRSKYSQPVYGTDQIPSRNFKEPHIWIHSDKDFNPYNTLHRIFDEEVLKELELEDHSLKDLKDGGAAMIAYAQLQFSDLDPLVRQNYRDALLRYCELDTMAMVMIWEYWGNEIEMWR